MHIYMCAHIDVYVYLHIHIHACINYIEIDTCILIHV